MNARHPLPESVGRHALLTESPAANLVSSGKSSHFLPRQLVTLAFLSDRLPDSLIAERVAESLCGEAEARVLLLRIELQDGEVPTAGSREPDAFLNGEFH